MARRANSRGSLVLGGAATALTLATVLLFGNLIGYGADVRKSTGAMHAVSTNGADAAGVADASVAPESAAADAGVADEGAAPESAAIDAIAGSGAVPSATPAAANPAEHPTVADAAPAGFVPPWEVNEDYYCDLVVPGSDIVFPVVKGSDNTKYLTRAFTGEESEVGSIFMDHRCTPGETPHTIIYGHDAQDLDGTPIMFGTLRSYLEQEFIDTHMELSLMRNGEVKRYELFAVKVTDSSDEAYDLDFSSHGSFDGFAKAMGAPEGTKEILTLSTCLGEGDDRLLVQGALL